MAELSSPTGSSFVPAETEGLVRIRRALLSVSNPQGLGPFARGLRAQGIELLATEGTRHRLSSDGLPVRGTEELTGIGAWFGGRLKTLHPGILGGILAPRSPEGERELAERKLVPIDLVAVNFYPFAEKAGAGSEAPDLADYIDIGGVTLARAAAKNFAAVTVVTDPTEYAELLQELETHRGAVTATLRRTLAARAFARTEQYDRVIGRALTSAGADGPSGFPPTLSFRHADPPLRYGENPHQRAAAYAAEEAAGSALVPTALELVQGSGLSYTNLLDLDTALAIVAEFAEPAAAVVKHATPVGVASAPKLVEAITHAVATDPVARYGCVIAVNRPITDAEFSPLHGIFVDLLAAPELDASARKAGEKRAKLKLARIPVRFPPGPAWEVRTALGRLLVQEADRRPLLPQDLRLVTSRGASAAQMATLEFAWRVVRHAKSNAIVLAQGNETVGIGSGQPTRIKAVELAVEVAGVRARNSVLASDAFFPFADGVEAAGKAGIRAIVQPGGSLRDPEVVAAAEKSGIAMYCTGWRVFRH